jgi:hypothetical protein
VGQGLLYKLTVLNFSSYLMKTIYSYLDCRTFQTSFQSAKSTCRGMRAGLAQSGLVSPVLFNLYVNDIPTPYTTACSQVRKLQAVQYKGLHIANNAPWYVSNKQIHEGLGILFFTDHIRALTESFDPKLANAGNPLVRQHGRHLCRPRAD